jgi:hypothetical protein
MKPIDQPFRPKWDFFVAWAFLAVATFLLTRQMEQDEGWYAYSAILILLSLFATIIIYGPVLLVRQIIRSDSRGWFVARVALTIVIAASIFFLGFHLFAPGKEVPVLWIGIISGLATFYLNWKINRR